MKDVRSEGKDMKAADVGVGTVYTLCVTLKDGDVCAEFCEKNPVVSRTIEIRGDQSLYELHLAIQRAFGWDNDHLWEFQLGGTRMGDRKATRYGPEEDSGGAWGTTVRSAEEALIGHLGIRTRSRFFYLFDFGASWLHEIRVTRMDHLAREETLPRVVAQVGENSPQYPCSDEV